MRFKPSRLVRALFYLLVVLLALFLYRSIKKMGLISETLIARDSVLHAPGIPLQSFEPTQDAGVDARLLRMRKLIEPSTNSCSMLNCFNLEKCKNGFKFYLYPVSNGSLLQLSRNFQKVLNALRRSEYATNDPKEACIFIPMIDVLDRDVLSAGYVPTNEVESALRTNPYWNRGENNLLFNFFSGTYPHYSEYVDFDTGKAMLAKTSLSIDSYRPHFDVSLPLIKLDHPEVQDGPSVVKELGDLFPIEKKYLLTFKGKRYLYGIGSESRAVFHHLHNDRDIVLVTTCQHGKDWEKWKDHRCTADMELYDKYDYQDLLVNSTFCAVPRGRRLGTYRFLEALQAGCIPISLGNDYILPFQEVLDWNQAVFVIDEGRVLQLPLIVNQISSKEIFKMRAQIDFLWEAYFSSVQKIVDTTLEIIHKRVRPRLTGNKHVWSTFPGGLAHDRMYSTPLADSPFQHPTTANRLSQQGYTIIVRSYTSGVKFPPLWKLFVNMATSKRLQKVIIEWIGVEPMKPSRSSLPSLPVPVVIRTPPKDDNLYPWSIRDVPTDAVFLLDEAIEVISDEVESAFDVWCHHQDQIVGFYSLFHHWDEMQGKWQLSSEVVHNYSLIHTRAAMILKYYIHHWRHLSESLLSVLRSHPVCEDVLFNILVSSIVPKPPIFVAKLPPSSKESKAYVEMLKDSVVEKESCLSTIFGLLRSDTLSHSVPSTSPDQHKTSAA